MTMATKANRLDKRVGRVEHMQHRRRRPRISRQIDASQVNGRLRFGWSSVNWSGYAITGSPGEFHSIAAKWKVPQVYPTAKPSYTSFWIGIDGYTNSSLIQAGTEHDYFGGAPHYYVWWEVLPHAERRVSSVRVKPGDIIYCQIKNVMFGQWSICLRNLTNGDQYTSIQSYKGPQTSVEWVLEAPVVGNRLSHLGRFTPITVESCTVNGSDAMLALSDRGVMVRRGRIVSLPSRPSISTDGFLVHRAGMRKKTSHR